MKRHYAAFYALLLVSLSACSVLGIATPQTFNERLAAGYTTVTGVRQSAGTLLTADKITADDAQNVQKQADTARTGLDLAAQIHVTDPNAGSDKLDSVVVGLTALQAYLQSKGK